MMWIMSRDTVLISTACSTFVSIHLSSRNIMIPTAV
jgi:hypothetical protein